LRERNGRGRNNKERVERSDFWLCAEEKLSETRPRKIRAGVFDRVGLGKGEKLRKWGWGTWLFFKEGKLNWVWRLTHLSYMQLFRKWFGSSRKIQTRNSCSPTSSFSQPILSLFTFKYCY